MKQPQVVNNLSHGQLGEQSAVRYLIKLGFKILAQNYRTSICEIDIIAIKQKTIYFVEVKYRQNNHQGEGVDYVTSKKLNQMKFAARVWQSDNDSANQGQIAIIEVSGEDYRVTDFITDAYI